MTLVGQIAELQNYTTYKELAWEGSFEDYLALVRRNPQITRNAYQRLYDMVLSHGVEEYIDNKKKLVRYKFFRDESHGGRDAVFGLDVPLMRLMNVLKSAAQGYGTERRIILLHGPVGSAKSTIARQLKKGIEEYSKTPDGALYTYFWNLPGPLSDLAGGSEVFPSPMHDEPLRLIPREWREDTINKLKLGNDDHRLKVDGDVNPACRLIFKELMRHHGGNFEKVMGHVRVKRLVLSEQDRIGIGTFQPKDEKNQDSTELTG
ncbi:MAG: putative serine protein kinase, PrkA, partial [Myxococcales bacterium]|nr:putative serine protein kinase, PrkA [Myxococcales bacterium]